MAKGEHIKAQTAFELFKGDYVKEQQAKLGGHAQMPEILWGKIEGVLDVRVAWAQLPDERKAQYDSRVVWRLELTSAGLRFGWSAGPISKRHTPPNFKFSNFPTP